MQYEVFDFHTHPFLNAAQNICAHKECADMTPAYTREMMERLGVSGIAGSVIRARRQDEPVTWAYIQEQNDAALALR